MNSHSDIVTHAYSSYVPLAHSSYVGLRATYNLQRMKNLLSDILSSVKACRIVLDGIDKCHIEQQKVIISIFLATQRDAADSCKILFSCRNEEGYIKGSLIQSSIISLQGETDDAELEYRMLERMLAGERLDTVSSLKDVENTLSSQDSEEMDSAGTASLSSELGSIASNPSASSCTTNNGLVVGVFMNDEELFHLFIEAFNKYDHGKVLRHGARLLKWLGRRLSEVAKTPTEKAVARFFISRMYDSALMRTMKFRVSKYDAREQSSERPNQSSIKQERLETYFQGLMHTSSTDTEMIGMIDSSRNESKSSRNSANDEKEIEDIAQPNIAMLKLFLRSSDAFMRFKEELNDFNRPCKNETMWRKKLWFGRQQVYFELPTMVPGLTRMDKVKLLLGRKLGKPIQWWPLKQPRRPLSSDKVRMMFLCVGKGSCPYFGKDTNPSARTAGYKDSSTLLIRKHENIDGSVTQRLCKPQLVSHRHCQSTRHPRPARMTVAITKQWRPICLGKLLGTFDNAWQSRRARLKRVKSLKIIRSLLHTAILLQVISTGA